VLVLGGKRTLARLGPGAEASLDSVLRLLAPVTRIPGDSSATCVLVEHESPEDAHTVRLIVENGRVALGDSSGVTLADARVQAVPEQWDDALLVGPTRELRIGGDESLAIYPYFMRIVSLFDNMRRSIQNACS
jgi:hypothetical protein